MDSIKRKVLYTLHKKMNDTLLGEIKMQDSAIQEHNVNVLEKLMAENPSFSILPESQDRFKEIRDHVDYKQYYTPTAIYAGEIMLEQGFQDTAIFKEHKSFALKIPMLLPTGYCGIGFLNSVKHKDTINRVLESLALKTFFSFPDGLCRVTIIDPYGAGQSFKSAIMLNEKITENKVLVNEEDVVNEMKELRNTQMRIANTIAAKGFESIEEYNKTTDEIPQPYRVIIISNFPHGFSKESVDNLLALLESPERSGYYFFISFDIPKGFDVNDQVMGVTYADLMKNMVIFEVENIVSDYITKGVFPFKSRLRFFPMKCEDDAKKLMGSHFFPKFEIISKDRLEEYIHTINNKIVNMNLRPILEITKTIPEKFWTDKPFRGISVPFAKNGIENVHFSLGVNEYGEDESVHHGIVCGATGSGKTVTIHDIILHTSMKYSPKDIRFWLLDYKEGTEFAIYKDYPFVEILSMESEIEFGHDVLQKAITEMERRGKYFKKLNARNLQEYHDSREMLIKNEESKLKSEEERVEVRKKLEKEYPHFPRIIIFIDEFQEMYPNIQYLKDKTNEFFRNILRRGRSFGFNLVLSTQTLKGVDLSDDILSNMPLRIALKMDEKDASILFKESNVAPKFLKNPGEGIYNKQYGEPIWNISFQAFLAQDTSIERIKRTVMEYGNLMFNDDDWEEVTKDRFVYIGGIPGVFKKEYIENVKKASKANRREVKLYIGNPAGLDREEAYLLMKKEFSNNIIVIGTDRLQSSSMFYYLLKQISEGLDNQAKIYFGNSFADFEDVFQEAIGGCSVKKINNKNYEEIVEEIYQEFKRRTESTENTKDQLNAHNKEKDIYIVIFGINSMLLFTQEQYGVDTPMDKMEKIMQLGPEYGIHTILYGDSYSSLMHIGFTKNLSYFNKRISFGGESDMKIFGDAADHLQVSKSPLVGMYRDESISSAVRKFKPYIKMDISGASGLIQNSND